ncbi:AAA family ATPase [Salicibibacter halophilus]|nr:AAA family ATPase [Salicibibacter halophilus]
MIIEQLSMVNFRQFYGKQSISFSSGDQQTVTVIQGENGRGKTGIYRAVLFALYGDEKLDQDGKGADIIIPNTKALNEEHDPVKVEVSLVFSREDRRYEITRSLLAAFINDQVTISNRTCTLQTIDKEEKIYLTKTNDVEDYIDGILDKRMRHYFFFDGERIERLTRASSSQKKDVATGIKNLLNIDQLNNAETTLSFLENDVKKKLEKHSTGKYQQNLQEQLKYESLIEQRRTQLETKESDFEKIQFRLDDLKDHLMKFEEQRKQEEHYERLLKDLQQQQKNENHAMRKIVDLNDIYSLLLMKDPLYQVNDELDLYLTGYTEQSGADVDWLDSILNELTCICDRPFTKDSESYRAIEALKKSMKKSEEKKQYYPLKSAISKLLGHLEAKEDELGQSIEEVRKIVDTRSSLEEEIKKHQNERSESGIETVSQITNDRDKLMEEKSKLQFEMKTIKNEWKDYEKTLESLKRHEGELKVKSQIHQKLARKQEEIEAARNALQTMVKDYEKGMIDELEDISTENLHFLIDEGGRINMRRIKIKSDYSLEVENGFGQEFLANISQGQRQILSLSFITALAQIAGGETVMEMPLFMDTPFGRLSAEHHDQLISFIPNVCSQWVLLVTDREFTSKHEEELLAANHLGNSYSLITKEEGVTEIVEMTNRQEGVSL